MLRVLEVKAAAGEASIAVTDLAMKVCGGAAFRKELGVERRFRDARPPGSWPRPPTPCSTSWAGPSTASLCCDRPDGLLLGAVAYDPKVVTIWDGFRRWFADHDFPFDYVLYSNYERQVEDLVAGRTDVAWNSPLAWVRSRRLDPAARAVAMRDTDRDLTSVIVVRRGLGHQRVSPASRGRVVGDRRGRLAPGARFSRCPCSAGRRHGACGYDIGVGLHGDHIGGERDAARALAAGEVDAACMIDANHLALHQGRDPARGRHPDHRPDRAVRPLQHDRHRSSGRPAWTLRRAAARHGLCRSKHPPLLDLEGLTSWLPGRTEGYSQLESAVDRLGFYDPAGKVTADGYRP